MEKEKFIQHHSDNWEKLETISAAINKKGPKKLSSQEIKQFLHLFRQCSRHLAYARTHYPESELVNYLNALIGNCHSQIYAVDKTSSTNFLNYIFYRLPELLTNYKYYILTSFGFFSLGLIVSLLLVIRNPSQAHLFLPARFINSIKHGNMSSGEWNYALMSSKIMVNNITVALKSFVLGITLGLGTIYVLFFNGALLGSLTALIYLYGNPLNYWSLILPHGIIELTAIFISGAAGLIVAKHLLLPGNYYRKDSLIFAAKKAVSLIMGVILLLITAGLIEGFFTPRNISAELKLLFAAATAVFLAIYFSLPYIRKKINNS